MEGLPERIGQPDQEKRKKQICGLIKKTEETGLRSDQKKQMERVKSDSGTGGMKPGEDRSVWSEKDEFRLKNNKKREDIQCTVSQSKKALTSFMSAGYDEGVRRRNRPRENSD